MRRDDLDEGLVWGIASTAGGAPDTQGDVIDEAELQRAAHEFMSRGRTGGILHLKNSDGNVVKAGEIVESLVLSGELQKALGIDLGGKVPWLICMKVTNPAVRKAIARGELRGFSIGGAGKRTPIEE